MSEYHYPVMLSEVLEGLALRENGLYFDGTIGGANHSCAILEAQPTAKIIGTDKDDEAIAEAKERLAPFEGRYELHHTDYKNYAEVLGDRRLDGFLLDFGISSHQIDDPARGFAYRAKEAPLDMRMDRRSVFTAYDVVNGYSEEELREIIQTLGEEPFASAIARSIVRERQKAPIGTCGALKDIVENSMPPKFRSANCAARTFQAIRIEVNGELEGLESCIRGLIGRLNFGGRACILTFHSLEDRIVKQVFRDLATACTCPKSFPVCVCGRVKELEIITPKPLVATEEECEINSRSKSAKLRIAEKL